LLIPTQRLLQLLKHDDGKATLAEALAYLYPATFIQPFDHDWTAIYLWLGRQCLTAKGTTVPDDAAPTALNPEQHAQLDRLLTWLWKKAEHACRRQPDAPAKPQLLREANDAWVLFTKM
jgi:hypothetical protein